MSHIDRTKTILALSIPIAIQGVLLTSLGFMDSIMVSSLSEDHLAAMGIGSRWFWFLSSFLFSIAAGASIILAQLNGDKKKPAQFVQIAFIGLLMVTGTSLIIGFVFVFFPQLPISLFTKSDTVSALARPYIQCMGLLAVITAISAIFDSIFRAVKKSRLSLYSFIVELVVNMALNYCLIFGKMGFPELGILGAGVASLIARTLRTGVLMAFMHHYSPIPLIDLISYIVTIKRSVVKNYCRITGPVVVSSLVWSTGVFVVHALFASMGSQELAVMTFITPIECFGLALVGGICQGSSVAIGNTLGARRFDEAEKLAAVAVKLAFFSGIVIAVCAALVGYQLINLTNLPPESQATAHELLFVVVISIAVRCVTATQMHGILKSGGDTKFCMYMDGVSQWLIIIPLLVIAIHYFHMPLFYAFLFVQAEEFIKLVPSQLRIRSNHWRTALAV
ncbi:MAG: hypothetical protein COA42_10280 [Alteromonadaceae bacterium]|nr:MAG: hypothetical protein COA42_10280 [Alteromonadaceae bacterium]